MERRRDKHWPVAGGILAYGRDSSSMEPELELEHGAVKRAATRAERQRRSWGKDAEWAISCGVPAIVRSSYDSEKQIMIWE
jgi:hypothetical protein